MPRNALVPYLENNWLGQNQARDDSISRLITTWKKQKLSKGSSKLPPEEAASLKRQFKDAEQGQSAAIKFMHAILKTAGIDDPAGSCEKAPIKNWERAVDKWKKAGRNTHDIGRGRIYFNSLKEYQAIMKVLNSRKKDGAIPSLGVERGRIISDSVSNYLENPRKSGFAGSVNLDIEIDLGKGRNGFFEIQVMPRIYMDTDKKSHPLFDLIRILQEDVAEAWITKEDKKVEKALVVANSCLFLEEGIRSGYFNLRGDLNSLPKISKADLNLVNDVLDRIRTTVEGLEGRRFAWKTDILESTTYAKTSVLNIFLGQDNKIRQPKASRQKLK